MKGNKRVRLEDIARELGLTKVSVSKALRDHPDISAETKIKVKDIARKLGYTPNFIARSLTSRRSHMIGVIVPKIAHYFFSRVIEGIRSVASRHNFEIILCVSKEDPLNERKQLETLLAARVDGILISISEGTTDLSPFEAIADMQLPLVLFDRTVADMKFSTVTVDDRGGSYEGVSYMIHRGFSDLAHLAGYPEIRIGRDRREGYEEALRDAGISVDESRIVTGGFSERDGYYGFKKLCEHGDVPEVIYSVTYPVGLGAYEAALDLGIPLDRFRIIAFGGSDINRYLSHPMICIEQPAREIGNRAVSLLINEIEQPQTRKLQHIVLPTRVLPPATAEAGTRLTAGVPAGKITIRTD